MADILEIASIICFVLALLFLVIGGVLFFTWNVRKVSAEVQGRNISPASSEKKKKSKRTQEKTEESTERNTVIPDEPATILDNGEIGGDSLVSCYEPGTELSEDSETEAEIEAYTEDELEPNTIASAAIHRVQETTESVESDTQKEQWKEEENGDWANNGFVLQKDILLADYRNALDQLF